MTGKEKKPLYLVISKDKEPYTQWAIVDDFNELKRFCIYLRSGNAEYLKCFYIWVIRGDSKKEIPYFEFCEREGIKEGMRI